MLENHPIFPERANITLAKIMTRDHIIIRIADICRLEKRKSDVVARFGGEEFLLLLPETDLDEAQNVAERLRRLVETREFSIASRAITWSNSAPLATAVQRNSFSTR